MTSLTPLVTGLTFPESPRWHNGRLWFSDFYSHAVYATDLSGQCKKMLDVPAQPSGLGWLPDGDLLVVSMTDQKVLRWDGHETRIHADLSALTRFHCNDMIVLADGSAYVGNFGFNPASEEPRDTALIRLDPEGNASIAAEELAFPNGMALINDGQTLVVAESVAQCLTAFNIAGDGTLSNRRVFARTPECQPDGICIDAAGNILVTTMTCNKLVTYAPNGKHLKTLTCDVPLWAVTVADSGETLLCTSPHSAPDDCMTHKAGAIQLLSA
jgi:sugar lactone lactonase YvrE